MFIGHVEIFCGNLWVGFWVGYHLEDFKGCGDG
jgi:hypothetical protein